MTTPTTKNPYLLYKDEPPNWHSHGNVEPWETYKKRVQSQNEMWWKVHTADGNYPHQTTTDLGVEGSDFPLGQGNRYGPFIYCPFPVEGIVRWAFRREDGFAAFRVDLANDSLPKGGSAKAVLSHEPIKAKPAAKKPEPIQSPPPAAIQSPPVETDLSADDAFADLDLGTPEPAAAAVEPDPFADLDMGEPQAESAPAEPVQPDAGEPEVDEWGEVIAGPQKAADPFDL